ncbi:MAG: hypothetical protein HQK77_16280 [Desulfobacterales bacterium]|nr:hypothetical protein [Desulfobacterales bacterium]
MNIADQKRNCPAVFGGAAKILMTLIVILYWQGSVFGEDKAKSLLINLKPQEVKEFEGAALLNGETLLVYDYSDYETQKLQETSYNLSVKKITEIGSKESDEKRFSEAFRLVNEVYEKVVGDDAIERKKRHKEFASTYYKITVFYLLDDERNIEISSKVQFVLKEKGKNTIKELKVKAGFVTDVKVKRVNNVDNYVVISHTCGSSCASTIFRGQL